MPETGIPAAVFRPSAHPGNPPGYLCFPGNLAFPGQPRLTGAGQIFLAFFPRAAASPEGGRIGAGGYVVDAKLRGRLHIMT